MKCQFLCLQRKNFKSQLVTLKNCSISKKLIYMDAWKSFLPNHLNPLWLLILIANKNCHQDIKSYNNFHKASHLSKIFRAIPLKSSKALLIIMKLKMLWLIGVMIKRYMTKLKINIGIMWKIKLDQIIKLNMRLIWMQISMAVVLVQKIKKLFKVNKKII